MSLAHIMDWVKATRSSEQCGEITSKVLGAALKWAKSQKSFADLPRADQAQLVRASLGELFVLQAAEGKVSVGELAAVLGADGEAGEAGLQALLHKFASYKVDLMEFFLLKSIALFRAADGRGEVRERAKVESVQEECFGTLFNYSRLNYAGQARFGRLLLLFGEVGQCGGRLVERSPLLKGHDISQILSDIN